MRRLDTAKDGCISFDEFLNGPCLDLALLIAMLIGAQVSLLSSLYKRTRSSTDHQG